jgi:serine/threonine-protein kinase
MRDSARQGSSASYIHLCDLAEGGMGRVALALRREGQFRRLYALKRIKEEYREESSVRAMFLEEARISGLIRHPNVVSVLDVGEDAEGPFLVMDYVEGISAATLLRGLSRTDEQLPLQLALDIARQAAEGLHAAHETRDGQGELINVVHRDVSPHNVLLGFDGMARVNDFGIAKALGRATHTTTGVLKGQLGYMSPELLRFEEPDRRSDLFSLGVVLYELLTRSRLYSNSPEGARRILHESAPDVRMQRSDVPGDVAVLLQRLLAKPVNERPATGKEVASQLERSLAELVRVEGKLDPGEFIQQRFSEHREELQRRIDTASNALWDQQTQSEAQPKTASHVRRRRVWAPVVTGATIAILGVGTGFWLAADAGDTGSTSAAPAAHSGSAPQAGSAGQPGSERGAPANLEDEAVASASGVADAHAAPREANNEADGTGASNPAEQPTGADATASGTSASDSQSTGPETNDSKPDRPARRARPHRRRRPAAANTESRREQEKDPQPSGSRIDSHPSDSSDSDGDDSPGGVQRTWDWQS